MSLTARNGRAARVALRSDLPPLPERMQSLPVDRRGYPVPWFVGIVNGQPDFRVADQEKLVLAVQHRLCWLCGQPLGRWLAFAIGPMCCVNRISAEPPSHRSCAHFAVRACPFLMTPQAVRRAGGMPANRTDPAGIMIESNPGGSAVYLTETYEAFRPQLGNDGVLFAMGEPVAIEWFARGQRIGRAEVDALLAAGLPRLRAMAKEDGPEAMVALHEAVVALEPWLPGAASSNSTGGFAR